MQLTPCVERVLGVGGGTGLAHDYGNGNLRLEEWLDL